MTDVPPTPAGEPEAAAEEELPPYVIEGARSSRSRCKTCKRKIDKDVLRIGILIEGPYGIGYMWHHLNCAAKRKLGDVEEAYANEAWNEAKVPPTKVPAIEKLRELQEKAEEKKASRKKFPYVEADPSGRAACKHCGEAIAKGDPRFVVGREVEFGGQVRVGPINVHPACVSDALDAPDSGTEREGFAEQVKINSTGVDPAFIDKALAAGGV